MGLSQIFTQTHQAAFRWAIRGSAGLSQIFTPTHQAVFRWAIRGSAGLSQILTIVGGIILGNFLRLETKMGNWQFLVRCHLGFFLDFQHLRCHFCRCDRIESCSQELFTIESRHRGDYYCSRAEMSSGINMGNWVASFWKLVSKRCHLLLQWVVSRKNGRILFLEYGLCATIWAIKEY